MKKNTIAVSALMVVVACGTPIAPDLGQANLPSLPTAPVQATVTRDHDVLPFEQTVNNTCSGEMVRITTKLHVLDQVVTMADGEIRTVFHTNFQNAVGVGLTSGKKYRASSADNSTWQGAPSGGGLQGGPWRTSHAGVLNLVVPGEGASFNLHFVFIVTKEPGTPAQFIVAKFEVTCH